MNGEDMFDEIIVHVSAWRRLRHAFIKQGEDDPSWKCVADSMVKLMDICYEEALENLRKNKQSMERQLRKMHENARYGRMDE